MKTGIIIYAVLAAVLSIPAKNALALEGAGVPVGPVRVYPAISAEFTYDDNILSASSNEKDSWITVISPQVRVEAKRRAHTFALSYRGDFGMYSGSSQDDYDDHQLLGEANLSFTSRASADLRAEYRRGHDDRGSTDRAIRTNPDEWYTVGLGGVFAYGAPGARGRIELEASLVDRNYTNNRSTTYTSDRTEGLLGAAFFYRVFPKTQLLAQVQYTNVDYDHVNKTTVPDSNQDSDELHYYLGVKWDATARTSGRAKVGWMTKSFDSKDRDDSSSSSWEVGVQWRPRSYSTFDFSTSRNYEEATGIGDSIELSRYAASWKHHWTSRISTSAKLLYAEADYQNTTADYGYDRQDDLIDFAIGADYAFRRWLNVGARYNYSSNDSNVSGEDYDRNIFTISVDAAL